MNLLKALPVSLLLLPVFVGCASYTNGVPLHTELTPLSERPVTAVENAPLHTSPAGGVKSTPVHQAIATFPAIASEPAPKVEQAIEPKPACEDAASPRVATAASNRPACIGTTSTLGGYAAAVGLTGGLQSGSENSGRGIAFDNNATTAKPAPAGGSIGDGPAGSY